MTDFALFNLLAESQLAYLIVVGVVSLLVGSFLNVVIYRLPIMMEREWKAACKEQLGIVDEDTLPNSIRNDVITTPTTNAPFNLVKPDSTCPQCQHKIRAWENIPIISWLFLKGQCSRCSNSISVRYPLIEGLTSVMSVLAAYYLGFTIEGAFFILATWLLIAMTFIDIDKMLLPDSLTLLLLWIGLGVSCFNSTIPPTDAIIGAMAGYLSLYFVYQGFKLLTGKEGMGFGDFKLLAALGAWIGWQHLPIVILLSSLVGAVMGIIIMTRKKASGELEIPFGPYLAAAGWLTMLFGDQIATAYLNWAVI